MSRLYMRAVAFKRSMDAHNKVLEKCRAAGVDVEAEDFDPYKPRNRAEKRQRVRTLPRSFRKSVHGRGQWRQKVVNAEGELERP